MVIKEKTTRDTTKTNFHSISHVSGEETQESFVLLSVFPYGKYSHTDLKKFGIIKNLLPKILFIDSETETSLIKNYNGFSLLQILTLEQGDL